MSFTKDRDSDNYATDKKGWEIIAPYIPKDKELDKPFILVCVSSLLLSKWFQQIFKDDLQVIIPFKRPTFTHLTNSKKGYSPPFGTMYFCYKMNLEKDLIFID